MKKFIIDKIENRYKCVLEKNFSLLKFLLSISVLAICITILLGTTALLKHYISTYNKSLNTYTGFLLLIFYIIIKSIITLLLINTLVKLSIRIFAFMDNKSFICIYFSNNTWISTFVIFFAIFSNSLSISKWIFKNEIFFWCNEEANGSNNFDRMKDIYNNINFMQDQKNKINIMEKLFYAFIFTIVTLFEDMVRYYVHYSIYHQCFRQNLLKCRENIDFIESIEIKKEGVTSKNKLNEIEISDLYAYITDKDFIEYSDMRNIYNNDQNTELFFTLFDINNDGKITRNEFVIRFKEIQNRFYNSILAYKKSKKSINKLQFITFPIALYLGFSVVGTSTTTSNAKNTFVGAFAAFASLSFMIGPALADLFKNIFQTFFSRPFDIGDTIIFSGLAYVVKDLGFLYTKLDLNGNTVYMANECFKKESITNLRNSNKFTAEIRVYVNNAFDNSDLDTFREILTDYLEKNKNKFKSYFKISNFMYIENRGHFILTIFIFMHEVNLNNVKTQKEKLIKDIIKNKDIMNVQLMI